MIALTRILPLIKKALPFVLVAAGIAFAYYEGQNKGFAKGYEKAIREEIAKIEIPACPPCNCPPAVSLNGFDADKLNNKKGHFHLHNNISNVQINVDTVMMRWLLQSATPGK